MDFPIKFGPLYIVRGHRLYFKKKIIALKINFVLANTEDPDEMPHQASFHLGLRWLPKYSFRAFRSTKGYKFKIS